MLQKANLSPRAKSYQGLFQRDVRLTSQIQNFVGFLFSDVISEVGQQQQTFAFAT